MKCFFVFLACSALLVQISQGRAQATASLAGVPPSCAVRDRDPAVLVQMYPRFPDVYVKGLEEGQSIPVDVTVFADGRISAALPKTTGDVATDDTAIAAAENSSYSPAIRSCRTVSSAFTVYVFYRRRTESPAPCNAPDQRAFVVSIPPAIWDRALTLAGPVTTGVTIGVGANGLVTSATVARSSGKASLDALALRDAGAASVEPTVRGCKTRADSVAYDVVFNPTLPTPDPSCRVRFQEATMTSAVAPIFPNINDPTFGSAEVEVRIRIAATGLVQSATILLTSGYPSVDAAAVRAARMSKFEPKLIDCLAVPSEYVFKAEFYQN